MSDVAFVVGATGYTGGAVVEVLRDLDVETIAHVRPGSSSLDEARARFEGCGARVDTTAWKLDAMAETLAAVRPTLVFSLLGTTRRRAAQEGMGAAQAYEQVDYGLSKLLLEACERAAPTARFVYLSSLGVTEDTSNPYLAARAKLEAALRGCDQPWTIARPSFITGADRQESRPAERMSAAAADALLTAVGWFGGTSVRDRYKSMDAKTLARGLVRVAQDPQAAGTVVDANALRG